MAARVCATATRSCRCLSLIHIFVGFTKTGERLVGQVAKRQAITNPDRTIASIKRQMGTDYKVDIDGKKDVYKRQAQSSKAPPGTWCV